ncbi:hypothetical protein P2W50_31195 [Pseudomonas protegens]|uniref:hypothetical protein n=1 Tax=Pseudomonas protegens TaxID=380021 RepID=UPI0023ED8CD0|nr:hypothetical protein [Pseudomonas protegens]MDF4211119.1 hypothetical protein [Pseudomonas protegens]
MSAVSQKKPTIPALLQLFLSASVLITAGTYLFIWSHDLAPQQEQTFKIIGNAIAMPFGLVVAFVWWAFHDSITSAVCKFFASLEGLRQKARAIFCSLKNRFK